jgi:hypothetical protein
MNAVVNPDEARKAVVNSLSNPSEDVARHVLALAGANPNQIEKSITTGTGLVAYDLQAPAKNLAYVDTEVSAHYADAVGMVESAADTLIVRITGGAALPAVPLVNTAIVQGFALLKAVIDQKEAAAKAAMSLPTPTSTSAPTVAGFAVSAIEAAAQTAVKLEAASTS